MGVLVAIGALIRQPVTVPWVAIWRASVAVSLILQREWGSYVTHAGRPQGRGPESLLTFSGCQGVERMLTVGKQ